MAKNKHTHNMSNVKELLSNDSDLMKNLIKDLIQDTLEAEITEQLNASSYERSEARIGYRSGYYTRTLITRVGKLELRVPRDREGRFSTEIFERYQRSEKALVATLTEMYVQGVSTRKVKAITEELCGDEFSAFTISELNKKLDTQLSQFANRRLESSYPYIILDARYEKVREAGVVGSQAVVIAIGINWEGRKEVLGVELANRESTTSSSTFRQMFTAYFDLLFSNTNR